eukprot:886488-Alexandrium_andersonii.AAC.1
MSFLQRKLYRIVMVHALLDLATSQPTIPATSLGSIAGAFKDLVRVPNGFVKRIRGRLQEHLVSESEPLQC